MCSYPVAALLCGGAHAASASLHDFPSVASFHPGLASLRTVAPPLFRAHALPLRLLTRHRSTHTSALRPTSPPPVLPTPASPPRAAAADATAASAAAVCLPTATGASANGAPAATSRPPTLQDCLARAAHMFPLHHPCGMRRSIASSSPISPPISPPIAGRGGGGSESVPSR